MVFFSDLKSASGKRIECGFSVVDCFFVAQEEPGPFLAIMGMVWIVNVGLVEGRGPRGGSIRLLRVQPYRQNSVALPPRHQCESVDRGYQCPLELLHSRL
jgi:hypothetical protein